VALLLIDYVHYSRTKLMMSGHITRFRGNVVVWFDANQRAARIFSPS